MSKPTVQKRILDTATRLFYSQGVRNTGINQIIKESKVAKASFYQYFPSKNTLINSCLDEYCVTLSRIFKSAIEKSNTIKDFAKRWRRIIKRNATKKDSFFGCPIANVGFQIDSQEIDFTKKFNEIIDTWYKIFTILFKKSVAAGELAMDTDFYALFRSIVEINEGALIMWRLTGKAEYLDSLAQSIIKVSFNGPAT